jgi:hypothetical protein
MTGPRVMFFLMVAHCLLASRPLREAGVVVLAGVLGTTLDSVQMAMGHLAFDGGIWLPGLVPLWMTALWVGFGSLFSQSLHWLRGRYLLGALLGAIGGALAYLGGARLGALTLHPDTVRVMAAVALQYAVATPILIRLSMVLSPDAGPEPEPPVDAKNRLMTNVEA